MSDIEDDRLCGTGNVSVTIVTIAGQTLVGRLVDNVGSLFSSLQRDNFVCIQLAAPFGPYSAGTVIAVNRQAIATIGPTSASLCSA
jgi:hypothetical protein